MCRPMYICTGFTTCICPAFYAAILLINILIKRPVVLVALLVIRTAGSSRNVGSGCGRCFASVGSVLTRRRCGASRRRRHESAAGLTCACVCAAVASIPMG